MQGINYINRIFRHDTQEGRAFRVYGSSTLVCLGSFAMGFALAKNGELEKGVAVAAFGTTVVSPSAAVVTNTFLNRIHGPIGNAEPLES